MNGKKTFECQSNRLLPYVKIFAFRKPNSVEMQVYVTMYYLSDEGRFRKTANTIEVAKNTVSIIIRWDGWQKRFQITLLTNILNFHGQRKKLMNPFLCFSKTWFPTVSWGCRWDIHRDKTTIWKFRALH